MAVVDGGHLRRKDALAAVHGGKYFWILDHVASYAWILLHEMNLHAELGHTEARSNPCYASADDEDLLGHIHGFGFEGH